MKYKTVNYKYINHIPNISSFILKRINSIDNPEIKALYKKQIFNITDHNLLEDYIAESGLNYYGLSLVLNIILGYFYKESKKRKYINVILIFFLLINPSFQLINFLCFRLISGISKDRCKSIGISSLIILIFYPYKVTSASFLFPFILRINSLLKPKKRDTLTLVLLLNSFFFNKVNIFKSLFYIVFSMISGLFMLIAVLSLAAAPIACILGNIYLKIMSFLNLNSMEITGKISIAAIIFYYLIIKTLPQFPYNKLVILLIILLFNISNFYGSVSFINVGHGDAILIRAPFNRENILIDTGSSNNYYQLKAYLEAKGIKTINNLLLTHSDEDHSGNVNNLINDFKVKNVIRTKEDLKTDYFNFIQLNQKYYEDVNRNSNCYYTVINNLSYLFTGDIDKETEYDLLNSNNNLKTDVLKVAHHGSNTSTSYNFIKETNPLISIISCSNKYGFPSKETIETLNNNFVHFLCTKAEGDIEIITLNKINILLTSKDNFYILKG